jgi:hypothetical protein
MNVEVIQIKNGTWARSLLLKEAVLATFVEPAPSIRARLGKFTLHDWDRAKYWLDVSGIALYFLDRLVALDLEACLPLAFVSQLRANLESNRTRTASLFSNAVQIARELRRVNVECALLKGATLPIESVPDCALRNQMDLDLLIRDADAYRVKDLLEMLGYSLDAISGRTWEFKAGPTDRSSLKHLYEVRPERAIELHLTENATVDSKTDRLKRAQLRVIRDCELPALTVADSLVQQGQHLFKHLCGEYTRVSWVLEFWRHVCARRNDASFWRDVELISSEEPGTEIAIGAATLLATVVFGPFAPVELSRWSMEKLPPAICLWIQLYGRRVLLSDTPGSKLYLLLRKELAPQSAEEQVARRRLLIPLHWPQRITRPEEGETFSARLRRYRAQAQFVMRRMRFHIVEGITLTIESMRWQRRLAGIELQVTGASFPTISTRHEGGRRSR